MDSIAAQGTTHRIPVSPMLPTRWPDQRLMTPYLADYESPDGLDDTTLTHMPEPETANIQSDDDEY